MNFLVEPDGRGGSLLSTETRVFATDAVARRRFAVYWRVIYPGSALIRRMWLRAIRLRAEAIVPLSPRPSVSTLGVPRDSVEAVLRRGDYVSPDRRIVAAAVRAPRNLPPPFHPGAHRVAPGAR